jgi:hypothetical protein
LEGALKPSTLECFVVGCFRIKILIVVNLSPNYTSESKHFLKLQMVALSKENLNSLF